MLTTITILTLLYSLLAIRSYAFLYIQTFETVSPYQKTIENVLAKYELYELHFLHI